MKSITCSFKKFIFALVLTAFFSLPIKAQHMIIGSYNLRYANTNDLGNLWQDRAPVIASLLSFHGFDIMILMYTILRAGVQEREGETL